jgi:non-ribosomal peptide synthase protein (TIGR01720 family)
VNRGGQLEPAPGPFPLTAIQRRFFEEHAVDPAHYNQSLLLQCARRLEPDALRTALQALLDTHAALRLRFQRTAGGAWQQHVAERAAIPLAIVDLSEHDDAAEAMYAHSAAEQRGMHLTDGPLFRAALYRWRDADRLLLAAHHLVVDGVTWRILLEDLEAALSGAAPLAPTDAFRDWAAAQQAAVGRFESERAMWLEVESATEAAVDSRIGRRGAYADALEERVHWDARDTADLKRACEAYQTNVGELLLAAVSRALGRWTGLETLTIALEGHGRDALDLLGGTEVPQRRVDVSRTAGWFTTVYPVVLDLRERPVHQRVREVKEALRRVPSGGAGYGILRYLAADASGRALSARPPVSFNYLGELGRGTSRLLSPAGDRIGPVVSPHGLRPFALEISAIVANGLLDLAFTFDAAVERATMRRLREAADDELRDVVAHCLGRRAPELTPADLTHKALTLEELDGLFDED